MIAMYTHCSESAPVVPSEWFAFRVRPRHEKKVALQLAGDQEEYFLPLLRQLRNWGSRRVYVDLPLIPGYVFCRSHRFGLLPILKTPGVVDVIRVANSPAPIPMEEISALKRVISASIPIEPYPFVESGQTVTIQSGPLAGLSGIVTERRNARQQMVLSVSLLRRSVLLHVDLSSVCNSLYDSASGDLLSERTPLTRGNIAGI